MFVMEEGREVLLFQIDECGYPPCFFKIYNDTRTNYCNSLNSRGQLNY